MTATRLEEGRILGAGGLRICWSSHRVANPRATILVQHGFADHMGRYSFLIEGLNAAEIDVWLFDARGHGVSGGRRGHVDRFEDYEADLRAMIALVTERTGSAPFLLGHSQGGLIVCHAALTSPLCVRGVALSNPALRASLPVPGWKVGMAKGLSRLLPILPVPVGIPASSISRDPSVIRAYEEDPLVFSAGTTRWGAEFLRAQDEVLAQASRLLAPVLVLLGSADAVIDAKTTATHFRSLEGDVHVQTFEGYYHELFNEPLADRLRAIVALRDWILQHA